TWPRRRVFEPGRRAMSTAGVACAGMRQAMDPDGPLGGVQHPSHACQRRSGAAFCAVAPGAPAIVATIASAMLDAAFVHRTLNDCLLIMCSLLEPDDKTGGCREP